MCVCIFKTKHQTSERKRKGNEGRVTVTKGKKGQKRKTRNHSANKIKRRKENPNEIDFTVKLSS